MRMLIWPTTPNTFNLFRSTVNRFQAAGHFETSALNNPNMIWNTKRSKVPHLHITPTHNF